MKFTIEDILCQILRIGSIPCAAVVGILDGGLNIPATADPKCLLVADTDAVKSIQIISDASVTFVRTLIVDLLGKLRNLLVLPLSARLLPRKPAVVGASGNVQNVTAGLYRITVFFMAVPDRAI